MRRPKRKALRCAECNRTDERITEGGYRHCIRCMPKVVERLFGDAAIASMTIEQTHRALHGAWDLPWTRVLALLAHAETLDRTASGKDLPKPWLDARPT